MEVDQLWLGAALWTVVRSLQIRSLFACPIAEAFSSTTSNYTLLFLQSSYYYPHNANCLEHCILWFNYLFFRYLHGCVQSCDDIDACNSSLRNTISIALLPLLFAILGLQVSFLFRNYIVVSERVLWEPLKREWKTNFIRPEQSLHHSKIKIVSIIHNQNVPLNSFFEHHPYVIYYTTPYYVNCDK